MSWFCIHQKEGVTPYKVETWCECGYDTWVRCDKTCPYRQKPYNAEDDYSDYEYVRNEDDDR